MKMDQLKAGVASYLDNELMPLVPDVGLKKFGISLLAALLIGRLDSLVDGLANNWLLNSTNIVAGDEIDVDYIADKLIEIFPKDGLTMSIPLIGETKFSKNDVAKLKSYINGKEV